MTDTDRAAAEAIARKIREDGDPDVIAVEIIAVIRGRGWRPTEARPAPDWKPFRNPAAGKAAERGAALARELLGHRRDDPDAA